MGGFFATIPLPFPAGDNRVNGHVFILPFTVADVVAYTDNGIGARGANAFAFDGNIYLTTKAVPTTLVHEAVHIYAHGGFKNRFRGLDEGVTEYMARHICHASFPHHPVRATQYEEETNAATWFVDKFGFTLVAQAYFGGQIDDLRIRFGAISKGQQNELDQDWIKFTDFLVDAKNFVLALAMLK